MDKYTILEKLAKMIPFKGLRKYCRSKIFIKKYFENMVPKSIKAKVGKYSYFGLNCDCQNEDTVIGKFCSFANNVIIGPGEHPLDFISTSPFFFWEWMGFNKNVGNMNCIEPVTIGNDVWLADNVFVKGGVTIGDGAVCAAGAVVVKDVPPYAIVGGVPAKIIKYRFDEETIDKLLKLKWWDLPDEVIKGMPFKDVRECIEYLEDYYKKQNIDIYGKEEFLNNEK